VLALNLLLLQNYSPDTIFTGIGPAWSLGVEIVFYAALPLLVPQAPWPTLRMSPPSMTYSAPVT